MKEGPNIALLGSLVGDPARANMLMALLSGKALTATELAGEAGVTLQTASTHLKKLENGGLIKLRKQGRHRYFSLADASVGSLLEEMMRVAAQKGHVRTRTGPKDPALRKARVCYNHLAGEMGVQMLDSLLRRGLISQSEEKLDLTQQGEVFFADFGINISSLNISRRPLCKSCLDWSARRNHLAGALGTATLNRLYQLGWARKEENSRIVNFTSKGQAEFQAYFPYETN